LCPKSFHYGFLQPDTGLLFAGDLFTDHFGKPSPPPAILNDDSAMAHASIRTAARLDLEGVILNHARKSEPSQILLSLIDLADNL
jgi:glyoxylase-like metal-dependent hydrolase (beta-lactamase superfamily II)